MFASGSDIAFNLIDKTENHHWKLGKFCQSINWRWKLKYYTWTREGGKCTTRFFLSFSLNSSKYLFQLIILLIAKKTTFNKPIYNLLKYFHSIIGGMNFETDFACSKVCIIEFYLLLLQLPSQVLTRSGKLNLPMNAIAWQIKWFEFCMVLY